MLMGGSAMLSLPTFPLKASLTTKADSWQWKLNKSAMNIHFEQIQSSSPWRSSSAKDVLLLPTISDVSTVEEWRQVAESIVAKGEEGGLNCRATLLDWPGLGYSDRPKLDYNASLFEDFLVHFITSDNTPITSNGANDLVICGGGHAATIIVRATSKGLVRPTAIAAVAPTWAGPLPIVFGRDTNMESRYGLLRGTLRAPALGWMMYNMLVSNEKAIKSQYMSHVYADPENLTPSIIESRYALTKKSGARYVPAAFLTGLLDPVTSREGFINLFSNLEGATPVLVMATEGSPRRSKAEMEALREAKGVTKYVQVPGALLPQEEYPEIVAEELHKFLLESFAYDAQR